MVQQSVQAIYPIFVPNQVLESKALNELSDYFSEQTHLTRQHLIGVGVLKGLQVNSVFSEVGSSPLPSPSPSARISPTVGAENMTAPLTPVADASADTSADTGADTSAVADAIGEGMPSGAVQTRNIVATIQLSEGNCLTPNGYYLSLSDIVFTHYRESLDLFPLQNKAAAKSGSVIEIFDTVPNDGFLLSQLLENVPQADANFSDVFSDKALVMVADLQERPRQGGLIHYEVQYKVKTLKIRFFMVSVPDLEGALQDVDDFALLKQQRAFQSFMEQRNRIPALQRFGYRLAAGDDKAAAPTVSLSTITHTDVLRRQYEANCRHSLTVIAAQLKAIDGFLLHFPTISQAIVKQLPVDENSATFSSVSAISVSDDVEGRLSDGLVNLLSDAQALQNYSDYLHLIAIAAEELAGVIMLLEGYFPAARQQSFLVLGSASAGDRATARQKDQENRSDFVHYVDLQAKEKTLEKFARQYLRLYYLCHSFDLGAAPDTLTLTPSAAWLSAPLHQQSIPAYLIHPHLPAYWHDFAEQRSEVASADLLLYQSPSCDRYVIAGYQNKSCREIWARLNEYRDRYNLTFTILFLKLDSETPTAEAVISDVVEETVSSEVAPALPQFHEFAQRHPGIEHWGGVPKGGTFIVLYEEDGEGGDRAISDFALPYYYVATPSHVLLAPPSFSLNYPEAQTLVAEQPLVEVTLLPAQGTLEGEGISKSEEGAYLFDAGALQDNITEETTLSLTARWDNHQLMTPPIRVFSKPFAQFWVGDVKTQGYSFREANSLSLFTKNSLRLRVQNKGGQFSLAKPVEGTDPSTGLELGSTDFGSTDEASSANGLFGHDPLTFFPENVPDGVSEVVLSYSLPLTEETTDVHRILIKIHKEETETDRIDRLRTLVGDLLPDQLQPHIKNAKTELTTTASAAVLAQVKAKATTDALNEAIETSVDEILKKQLAPDALQARINEQVKAAVGSEVSSQLNPKIKSAEQALATKAGEVVLSQVKAQATKDALNRAIETSVDEILEKQLAPDALQVRINEQVKAAVNKALGSQLDSAQTTISGKAQEAVKEAVDSSEMRGLLDGHADKAIKAAMDRSQFNLIRPLPSPQTPSPQTPSPPPLGTSNQADSSVEPVDEVLPNTTSAPVEPDEIEQSTEKKPSSTDEQLRNFEGDDGLFGRFFGKK
ncbi:MAG: hypothetical protein AB8B99_17885 [Phormidesmis sp.]